MSGLRRWGPWVIGIALVAVILMRVPLDAFRGAITHGPHLVLAAVDLLVTVCALCTDSIASWIGLYTLRMRRPFAKVFAVRGATSLLVLLNYAVGQGGFGYYLHRSGAPALRATGATLFLIGINLAAMLLITPLAWFVLDIEAPNSAMWWTITVGCGSFAAYLLVIAISPQFLVRRQLFAPLFDAGLRGHAIAILGRVPHVAIIVLGQWLALWAWDIDVPLRVAATVMPMVAIASSLPISPAGLGTSQAALMFFFSDYSTGATAGARAGNVLAYSIVHFVYALLASVVVGLVCAPFAKRALAAPPVEA